MIVWINGSFGSGKTSVAKRLNDMLSQSFLYDPEEAGFFIRDNSPPTMQKEDFQDFALWREINYGMIASMAAHYEGVVIIPMTLINDQYYDEIITKLIEDGVALRQYVLIASKETLLQRLAAREDDNNPWIVPRLDACIDALKQEKFGCLLNTDNRSIDEIVDVIIADLNIEE